MFYTKINKIKVFYNWEGFLGLFNRRAEIRIYSCVTPLSVSLHGEGGSTPTLSELANLSDDAARKQRLLLKQVSTLFQLSKQVLPVVCVREE
jgi:hypothetical protein